MIHLSTRQWSTEKRSSKVVLTTGTLSPLGSADSPTACAGFLAAYVGTTRKLLFSLEQHVTKCETAVLQYVHFLLTDITFSLLLLNRRLSCAIQLNTTQ